MGPIFLENKYMGPLNYNILLRHISTNREFPYKGLAAILKVSLNSVQYLLG